MANTSRKKPGFGETKEVNPLDKLLVNYENNKNRINTLTTVILVVILGYFGYEKLYKGPREDKAATSISMAERFFEMDSLNLALNGYGEAPGFLRIMKKYDGTPTANLCRFYAGECYLHLGDFNNAIKQLKDFDGKGTLVAYQAWGNLGDAYMEIGNLKQGIEYYKKAAGDKDDIMLTPLYLYRAGVAYEMNNQPDEAKKVFRRVRDEFPKSPEARDMDKELAKLGDLD